MYKKQMKCQKAVCLLCMISSVIVFLYALGIMTDLYDSLYSTMMNPADLTQTTVPGSIVYYNMQEFNSVFLKYSIGLILLACLLYITNTHIRRKYYIGNYVAAALFVIANVNIAIWAHQYIEIFKAFFYIMGDYFKVYGGQTALYILEAIVLVIVFCSFYYLKLYCCISVGQLAQKKKVLLAFGVFFGIYVIKQIIGTILIITVFNNYDLMAQIGDWIAKNETAFLHILLCSAIAFSVIFGLIYFLISKHIMSKKLNLN